jgi:hypothetical protein
VLLSTTLHPSTKNPLLLGSYTTIALLWGVTQVVLIPYVVHLILLVTAILYAACHRSSLALREDIPKEGEEGYDPDALRETLKHSPNQVYRHRCLES